MVASCSVSCDPPSSQKMPFYVVCLIQYYIPMSTGATCLLLTSSNSAALDNLRVFWSKTQLSLYLVKVLFILYWFYGSVSYTCLQTEQFGYPWSWQTYRSISHVQGSCGIAMSHFASCKTTYNRAMHESTSISRLFGKAFHKYQGLSLIHLEYTQGFIISTYPNDIWALFTGSTQIHEHINHSLQLQYSWDR